MRSNAKGPHARGSTVGEPSTPTIEQEEHMQEHTPEDAIANDGVLACCPESSTAPSPNFKVTAGSATWALKTTHVKNKVGANTLRSYFSANVAGGGKIAISFQSPTCGSSSNDFGCA